MGALKPATNFLLIYQFSIFVQNNFDSVNDLTILQILTANGSVRRCVLYPTKMGFSSMIFFCIILIEAFILNKTSIPKKPSLKIENVKYQKREFLYLTA